MLFQELPVAPLHHHPKNPSEKAYIAWDMDGLQWISELLILLGVDH